MKLYRINLRGSFDSVGIPYVVADDPTTAYDTVRCFLNDRELGFPKERAMESIELIADESEYPDCRDMLFLAGRGVDFIPNKDK